MYFLFILILFNLTYYFQLSFTILNFQPKQTVICTFLFPKLYYLTIVNFCLKKSYYFLQFSNQWTFIINIIINIIAIIAIIIAIIPLIVTKITVINANIGGFVISFFKSLNFIYCIYLCYSTFKLLEINLYLYAFIKLNLSTFNLYFSNQHFILNRNFCLWFNLLKYPSFAFREILNCINYANFFNFMLILQDFLLNL